MTTWLREIAGWVLLGIGVGMIAICFFVFLMNRLVVEGFIFAVIAVFVFRGGLGLLKVALAAKAMADIKKDQRSATVADIFKVRPQLGNSGPVGRPRPSVVPGPQS